MSTAVETAPVTVTERAVKELHKLKDQQELGEDFGLRGDDGSRRLLAGLDAGLVIAVDADQAGVQPHRALEESD